MAPEKSSSIKPRIIIHGGCGNITRNNTPPQAYDAYRNALLDVLQHAYDMLRLPNANALDIAAFAVSLLEDNALFNAGHGAVFTTAGTHELEASVMVSRGYRKRGVGVMKVRKAKNPIKLAREMLIRGEQENGGGAQGHCQLEGQICDKLVEDWDLETVKPSYFWTRKRWDQHRRGLGKEYDDDTYERHKRQADVRQQDDADDSNEPEDRFRESVETSILVDETSYDDIEYIPKGTVGAVVLDSLGTLCVATSTGGLTNKLPGRIGDTPTLGAGFWAEEWTTTHTVPITTSLTQAPLSLAAMVSDCIPGLLGYMSLPTPTNASSQTKRVKSTKAVAMSGTGNGDSFLRTNAVRTAAAIAQYSHSHSKSGTDLQTAVNAVAGPGGILQQSAEDRWPETGEGEGGIIGIELVEGVYEMNRAPAPIAESVSGQSKIVFDYNCGGMFHAWINDTGKRRFGVFQDEK